jgi:hypothetical protein
VARIWFALGTGKPPRPCLSQRDRPWAWLHVDVLAIGNFGSLR